MSKRAQTATVETTQNREHAVAERHAVAAATHADPTPPGLAQTLLALLESLGPPAAAATRAAFRGADPAWMLSTGQTVASEVILRDGTDFVRSVRSIWQSLSAEQRAAAKGYNPGLDAVLVHELSTLRGDSARYDRLALLAGSTLAERRQRARDAWADGVIGRQVNYQTLRDYLGEDHPTVVGLAPSMRAAQTADALAQGLDAVAAAIHVTRHGDAEHTASAELREDLDFAGLGDDAVASLRKQAATVRDTAEAADARPKDLAAAQRTLDMQDGRVLHVMGIILRGFRRARRRHPETLVPALGDLGRVFNVSRGGGEEDDSEPTPPTPPTPAPTPA